MVEISVENSVEVNLLPVNNNSEVSSDLINNSEENNEVPTVTDFIEISVDKSKEKFLSTTARRLLLPRMLRKLVRFLLSTAKNTVKLIPKV